MENETNANPTASWHAATAPFALPTLGLLLREAIALSLWLWVLFDALIFDLSRFALTSNPGIGWIYQYRFLIILGIVAIGLILLPRVKFMTTVGYVLLYPLILIIWRIPKWTFKNWPLLLVFSPALHSIVINVRFTFVIGSAAIISAAMVLFANSSAVVGGGMAVLLLYLARHYARRVRAAFAPSTVFADIGSYLRDIWRSFQEKAAKSDQPDLDPTSQDYDREFGQRIFNQYLHVTVLARVAQRLDELHRSRRLDLYLVGALAYTFILAITIYTVVYVGLLRIDITSFVPSASPEEMIGYSIGTMLHYSLSSFEPASLAAQLLTYTQAFASIVIGLLLVFLMFTTTRERYRNDVADIASDFASESKRLEDILLADTKLTLRAAEARLMQFNANVARWCLRWRYGEVEGTRIADELRRLLEVSEHTDR